ncbi:hypothetical protein [Streptomyces sp. NPDC006368]|uniref:hypothetical protein n=1 Tax=Streptomyces sp. NPDC006368 TaxID=3156760 RepID=UPI0033B27E2B
MHRLIRNRVVAAVGCLTALALAGCGGGGDDNRSGGAGREKDKGGAVTATPSPATPEPADGATAADDVEGAWLGITDGKAVNLTIKKGHAVVLAESRLCQGSARSARPGRVTLGVKCQDGNTDRATGSAVTSDGRKIVVTWDSGKKDTLTKSPLSAVPSSLPSLPPQP